MEYPGSGFCKDGYYADWDDKGEASVQDCKNLCVHLTMQIYGLPQQGQEEILLVLQ